uniref:Complexin-2 n=1 Tax=Myotis myotis TaxID=51298 RepID=A0A7J7XEP0_MYOMY|nr:complexin 2 [Myotis myotis]
MDFVMKQALGGATKDMGKMLGGEEEKDPDAQKKEEERQEALRQQEEERKAKHARMEAEREKVRQQIRDKYGLKKKEEKEAEEKAALGGRGGRGGGEHPGHGAQIPARAAAGHVQEVTGPPAHPHSTCYYFFFGSFFSFDSVKSQF